MAKVNGELALVTGASSGIGEAYARRLAEAGYDLVITARRRELLEGLASELRTRFETSVDVAVADLALEEDVARLEDRIGDFRNLSVLVNNAGFQVPGNFAEVDIEGLLRMVMVHDLSTMRLTRAALPGMLERRRGAIVLVSSMAGLLPVPYSATYNATKAFLVLFGETLSQELTGSGVRVQVLCPGYTRSGFHETAGVDRNTPESIWMTSDEVAVESLAALEKGKVLVIPGRKNRVQYCLMCILPRQVRNRVLRALAELST